MEKMRWFIIGNLIGFGVLIVGIGINESIKQKALEPSTDKQSQTTDQRSASQTSQSTSGSQQTSASAGVATGPSTHVDTPGDVNHAKDSTDTTDSKDPKDPKDADQNSPEGTVSASDTGNNVKTEARLVTTRDINKGTILHAGDIELRQVDGKLARKVGLTKFDTALGFKTRIELIEGEMLEPSDLETRETE
jgi:flagella basal body P-ring formation protein FlgA